MKRRVAGLGLAGLLQVAACGEPAPPAPKNLLLISIDTLRADVLGCYGSEAGATPMLDAWAQGALRFDSAWSHTCKTAPAHMSMLTGLPPRVHGIANLDSGLNQELAPGAVTLAETLRARGFRTAAFTGGGNVRGSLGFARGFELYDDEGRGAQKLPLLKQWIGAQSGDERWFAFFHTYQVHDPYLPPPDLLAKFVSPDYDGPIVADGQQLLAEIAAQRARDPQTELNEHGQLVNQFWRKVRPGNASDQQHLKQLYTAGVAALDRQLGPFLRWFEQQGLAQDTLIVITSDHGEEFGEHGMLRHEQLWQEVTHVPLLVRLPGPGGLACSAGRALAAPVRHIDLVPSLLELLEVADTAQLRLGTSWASWVRDPQSAQAGREVLCEHRSRVDGELDLWALRDQDWLLHQDRGGQLVLVDRARDPAELESAVDAPRQARMLEAVHAEQAALDALHLRYASGVGGALDAQTRAQLEELGYL